MADDRNKFSILATAGDGTPPSPPAAKAAAGDDGDENALIQQVSAMIAASRHLPDFGLIKAEIAADRREAEVIEKTDLLKERNHILEDVRPFINLMKKERPDDPDY